MNAAEDLVERVRSARKSRGWTQRQMAEQAGVSLRTYQNFENRAGTPQGANLRAILKAVEIDTIGEDTAEATRDAWPPDIRVYLDVIGAFLSTMSEEERADFMHDSTRRIVDLTRGTGK